MRQVAWTASGMLGLALALALPAAASPITWTIVNGSTVDGAAITGTFTVDTDLGTVSAWNITVASSTSSIPFSNLSNTLLGNSYATGGYSSLNPADTYLQFAQTNPLEFNFNSALSDAGGTIGFGGYFDTYNVAYVNGIYSGTTSATRTISGSVTATPPLVTPEPATWALVGTGLLGLLGLGVKRRGYTGV
jgi:hypothetical protein